MKTVDLLFYGAKQHGRARGCRPCPRRDPGMGFEYRAVTAPAQLHPLAEPFGVNENDPAGVNEPGMKTGSMVSSFVNACTAKTGVAIVGVSCAKGRFCHCQVVARHTVLSGCRPPRPQGAQILSRKRLYHPPQRDGLVPGLHRRRPAHPQGCLQSQHRARSAQLYAGRRRANLLLIQIGNQRDEPELYLPIQQAQEELTAACDDIIMVSRRFKTFAAKGVDERPFPLFAARLQRSGRGSRTQRGRLLESLTKYENPTAKRLGNFLLLHSVSHPAQIPHIGGVGGQNDLIAQQRGGGGVGRQEGTNGRIIHIARAQRSRVLLPSASMRQSLTCTAPS